MTCPTQLADAWRQRSGKAYRESRPPPPRRPVTPPGDRIRAKLLGTATRRRKAEGLHQKATAANEGASAICLPVQAADETWRGKPWRGAIAVPLVMWGKGWFLAVRLASV